MKKLLVLLTSVLLLAGCSSSSDGETVLTGTAKGHNGDLTVEVVVDESGKIVDANITEHSESAGIADPALEKVLPSVIEKGSTDGVEVVAGATVTSQAIIDAVNKALEEK